LYRCNSFFGEALLTGLLLLLQAVGLISGTLFNLLSITFLGGLEILLSAFMELLMSLLFSAPVDSIDFIKSKF